MDYGKIPMKRLIETVCIVLLLTVFVISLFAQSTVQETRDDIDSQELKKEVRTLMVEGRQLYLEGNFDEAIEKFHQVTDLKPNHLGARIAIKTILDDMDRLAALERENAVEERMLDTEKMLHFQRHHPLTDMPKDGKADVQESQKSPNRIEIERKLQKRIPEINFTNAHLRDIIQYLHTVGDVNIIMDESVFGFDETKTAPAIPESIDVESNRQPAGEESDYYSDLEDEITKEEQQQVPATPVNMTDRVTISLRDIPLIDALKYILRSKKLRYRIDDYAIWISRDVSAPELITKSYKLLGGKGAINKLTFEKPSNQGPSSGAKVEEILNIKDVVQEIVQFPAGSKMYLDARTNTLVVTNTKENHDIIGELIEKLSVPAVQVEIETRFVRISRFDSEELGLEMFVGGTGSDVGDGKFRINANASHGTYGQDTTAALKGFTSGLRFLTETIGGAQAPRSNILAIGGILGEADMRMVLHALNQRQNVDILTCPKVTTLNGHQAEIKSVREFIYPQEFEVIPPVIENNAVRAPAAVEASSFTRRDIGVILTVTPDVGGDRKTINLTLVPEVSRFVTWLDYGTDIGLADGTDTTHAPQLQPLFSSNHVATSVVVNNGDTIVLGGTISTQRIRRTDKIPFLGDIPFIGRAFRVESERDDKNSLLIFVTARLITPNGNALEDELRAARFDREE
jgi:type II secretory pathway component GspD/PulD (secretin)